MSDAIAVFVGSNCNIYAFEMRKVNAITITLMCINYACSGVNGNISDLNAFHSQYFVCY